MKKLLSIILSVLMLTSVFAGTGLTAYGAEVTSGDYIFTVSSYKATITDYIGEDTEVEIPSKLNGYTVTAIDDYAFKACWDITKVTIPSTVTTIGSWAFHNCQSLKEIVIPKGVTTIESYAFQSCSSLEKVTLPDSITSLWNGVFWYCSALTEVNIPRGVKTISNQMFQYCTSLENVTLHDSITAINQYAFSDCGLTSINIPASVTKIGLPNFDSSQKLTSINVDSENEYFSSADGVLFNKDKTTLIAYPAGRTDESYTIPDGVKNLEWNSFYCCKNLKEVNFSDTVSNIGSSAFSNCLGLTRVTLPDSLIKINGRAFESCWFLQEVDFGKGVQEIGFEAFLYCYDLKKLNFPASLTSIDATSFLWCYDLAEITVDKNNNNYSVVDNVLFNKDKTTLILYPEGNSATAYTMPDTVTTVGKDAFHNSNNLTEIKMSKNLRTLDSYSFAYCGGLKEAVLYENVINVNESAFRSCSSLEKIYFLNPDCVIYDEFYTINTTAEIYGYTGSTAQSYAEKYNRTFAPFEFSYNVLSDGTAEITGYSGSETDVVIPSIYCCYKISAIAEGVFKNPASIKSVTIPEYVVNVGSKVFENCTALETLNFNAINCTNFATNNASILTSCTALKTVNFGDMVEAVPAYGFQDCTSIETVTFGNSLKTIGLNSFYGCTGIKALEIPDSVTTLNHYCFYGCTGIEKIKLGNRVEFLGAGAFDNCRGLAQINMPESLVTIRERAFYRCDKLTSIVIPENVTTIGRSAFSICKALESIYFFTSSCEIYDNEYTFTDANPVFYGYAGSTAEAYAKTYGKSFKELVQGDTSGDGELTITDATEIQKNIARITHFNQGQNTIGDVNGDGKISIRDVTYIQMYVAKIIENFPI